MREERRKNRQRQRARRCLRAVLPPVSSRAPGAPPITYPVKALSAATPPRSSHRSPQPVPLSAPARSHAPTRATSPGAKGTVRFCGDSSAQLEAPSDPVQPAAADWAPPRDAPADAGRQRATEDAARAEGNPGDGSNTRGITQDAPADGSGSGEQRGSNEAEEGR